MQEKIGERLPQPVMPCHLVGNEPEVGNEPVAGKLLGDKHDAGDQDDPADGAAKYGVGEWPMQIFEWHI